MVGIKLTTVSEPISLVAIGCTIIVVLVWHRVQMIWIIHTIIPFTLAKIIIIAIIILVVELSIKTTVTLPELLIGGNTLTPQTGDFSEN